MKPAWAAAAKYAESKYSNVVVADVDCTVEQNLCKKQGVRGYPTIKYWVGGTESKYSGGRTEEALTSFIDTKMGGTVGGTEL